MLIIKKILHIIIIAAINLVHMHVYLVYTENDKC